MSGLELAMAIVFTLIFALLIVGGLVGAYLAEQNRRHMRQALRNQIMRFEEEAKKRDLDWQIFVNTDVNTARAEESIQAVKTALALCNGRRDA